MRFTRTLLLGSLGFSIMAWLAAGLVTGGGQDDYGKVVAPFLEKNCYSCHGPDRQSGKLTLHDIDPNVAQGKDLAKWKNVAEMLTLGEMPPRSRPRPRAAEIAAVVAWIKQGLRAAGQSELDAERTLLLPGFGNRIDHLSLFSGKYKGPAYTPARIWRLRPDAYLRFLPRIANGGRPSSRRDIFKSAAQPFGVTAGDGFKDYAALYSIDEATLEQLIRNAQLIVKTQTTKTRLGKTVKEFLPLVDEQQPLTDELIHKALKRQFHIVLLREPTPDELSRFVELMKRNVQQAGRVAGVRATLATVLLLPEALYRFERGTGDVDAFGRRMLAPRELAYAISFALTDDPPDRLLLEAVENRRLQSREDVLREVRRILNDKKIPKPRIMRFFEEFFEFLACLEIFKDFPSNQWKPQVLVNDTKLLIEYILRRDRNVLEELLTTNKAFVNYKIGRRGKPEPAHIANKPGRDYKKRLMEVHEFYGLPPEWKWTPNQPVELPATQRAGILTQPSWLASFATNNENHAIRRGKWIRERLLGGSVPDLPITVDAKLPDRPDQTLRQRMEVTRQAYCWRCHQLMNPLGLTFEHYDFVGRFRETESVLDPAATARLKETNKKNRGKQPQEVHREVPIDATGEVALCGDPRIEGKVNNAVELMHKLAKSERVRQVFIRHAFRYWMGRNETLDDSPTLIAADRAYVRSGGSMKALIESLLTSDSFLYRKVVTGRDKQP